MCSLNCNPQSLDPPFKETFYSAVDKAMLLLGESGKQATYYHLEKTFKLKRNTWHKNPDDFAEAVEQIFGPGAQLLLKAMAKELYSSLGLKFEGEAIHFSYLVRKAQKQSMAPEPPRPPRRPRRKPHEKTQRRKEAKHPHHQRRGHKKGPERNRERQRIPGGHG